MKSDTIGYMDEISKDYIDGIRLCKTYGDLAAFVVTWQEFCRDAIQQVKAPGFSWEEYQKGERLERKGKYSGDAWVEKYGAILLPEVLVKIGLIAQKFHAPEGAAFHRLVQEKILIRDSEGYFYFNSST